MRKIIITGFIVALLACLFPPWKCELGIKTLEKEYAFLFTGPSCRERIPPHSIDWERLLTELVGISALVGVGIALAKRS